MATIASIFPALEKAEDDEEASASASDKDLDLWKTIEQNFLNASSGHAAISALGTRQVIDSMDSAMRDVSQIATAKEMLSKKQAVANVKIENDNFVRDNITGK